MEKTFVSIMVRPKTHQDVMLFKIRAKVKNVDEVIKMALRALKDMNGK